MNWVLLYVRMAVEPMRWLGEHVVIPMGWPILMGCVIGVCWWRIERGDN